MITTAVKHLVVESSSTKEDQDIFKLNSKNLSKGFWNITTQHNVSEVASTPVFR